MSLVQEKVQARLGCKRKGSQAGGRKALGVGPGGNCGDSLGSQKGPTQTGLLRVQFTNNRVHVVCDLLGIRKPGGYYGLSLWVNVVQECISVLCFRGFMGLIKPSLGAPGQSMVEELLGNFPTCWGLSGYLLTFCCFPSSVLKDLCLPLSILY